MLSDTLLFLTGVCAGWISMAGALWVACAWNDRKYRDEE